MALGTGHDSGTTAHQWGALACALILLFVSATPAQADPIIATHDGCVTTLPVAGATWTATRHFLVGDWNGDGRSKVGVAQEFKFRLDYDGSFTSYISTADHQGEFGEGDQVVIGDWNENGTQKVGTFDAIAAFWSLDFDGTLSLSVTDRSFVFGTPGANAIVGRFPVTTATPQ